MIYNKIPFELEDGGITLSIELPIRVYPKGEFDCQKGDRWNDFKLSHWEIDGEEVNTKIEKAAQEHIKEMNEADCPESGGRWDSENNRCTNTILHNGGNSGVQEFYKVYGQSNTI